MYVGLNGLSNEDFLQLTGTRDMDTRSPRLTALLDS